MGFGLRGLGAEGLGAEGLVFSVLVLSLAQQAVSSRAQCYSNYEGVMGPFHHQNQACGVPTRSATSAALVDLYVSTRGGRWLSNGGWNSSFQTHEPVVTTTWNITHNCSVVPFTHHCCNDTRFINASASDKFCIETRSQTPFVDISDTTYCSWYGVTCKDYHVIALELPKNNLQGMIPQSLGDLWLLERLNLMGNRLSGGIPASLGELDLLTSLALNDNLLSGHIPDLSCTKFLSHADFSANRLSGGLDMRLLPRTLSSLLLDHNGLDGEVASRGVKGWTEGLPGWCVDEHYNVINDGVTTLHLGTISECECLRLCTTNPQSTTTGCEHIYYQANAGCYGHSSTRVNRANNAIYHTCFLPFTYHGPAKIEEAPLSVLRLNDNVLKGPLPFPLVESRQEMDLSNNLLTGNITEHINHTLAFKWQPLRLRSLSLGGNFLHGYVPTVMKQLFNVSKLSDSDVSDGSAYQGLRMDLSDNCFEGNITDVFRDLGRVFEGSPQVQAAGWNAGTIELGGSGLGDCAELKSHAAPGMTVECESTARTNIGYENRQVAEVLGPHCSRYGENRTGVDSVSTAAMQFTSISVQAPQDLYPVYSLKIPVVRLCHSNSGICNSGLTVRFATIPMSAKRGIDYVEAEGSISWGRGDVSKQWIDVNVKARRDRVRAVTFAVSLFTDMRELIPIGAESENSSAIQPGLTAHRRKHTTIINLRRCTQHPGHAGGTCVPDQEKTCGDGVRTISEGCDDANQVSGDGCSADCEVEHGFTCSGGSLTSPDICTADLDLGLASYWINHVPTTGIRARASALPSNMKPYAPWGCLRDPYYVAPAETVPVARLSPALDNCAALAYDRGYSGFCIQQHGQCLTKQEFDGLAVNLNSESSCWGAERGGLGAMACFNISTEGTWGSKSVHCTTPERAARTHDNPSGGYCTCQDQWSGGGGVDGEYCVPSHTQCDGADSAWSGSQCIKYFSGSWTIESAGQRCSDWGGYLASIYSSDQRTQMSTLLPLGVTAWLAVEDYWSGGNHRFRWTSEAEAQQVESDSLNLLSSINPSSNGTCLVIRSDSYIFQTPCEHTNRAILCAKTDVDFDECAQSQHSCHTSSGASCTNTFGSFSCACGYDRTGFGYAVNATSFNLAMGASFSANFDTHANMLMRLGHGSGIPDYWLDFAHAIGTTSDDFFVQVDLGTIYPLSHVEVLMYYVDGRSHARKRVQVSATGNFTGEETTFYYCHDFLDCGNETSTGASVDLRGFAGRFIRVWSSISNAVDRLGSQDPTARFLQLRVFGSASECIACPLHTQPVEGSVGCEACPDPNQTSVSTCVAERTCDGGRGKSRSGSCFRYFAENYQPTSSDVNVTQLGTQLFDTVRTTWRWNESRAVCEAWGGDLAVITGSQQQETVTSMIKGPAWIGLRATLPAADGSGAGNNQIPYGVRWSNGTIFSDYSDWFGSLEEISGDICTYVDLAGWWKTRSCGADPLSRTGFVCSRPATE